MRIYTWCVGLLFQVSCVNQFQSKSCEVGNVLHLAIIPNSSIPHVRESQVQAGLEPAIAFLIIHYCICLYLETLQTCGMQSTLSQKRLPSVISNSGFNNISIFWDALLQWVLCLRYKYIIQDDLTSMSAKTKTLSLTRPLLIGHNHMFLDPLMHEFCNSGDEN